MRELKFRAWDTERKTYDHEELLLAPNGDIWASRWQELCEPESKYIVEQYTGLKDKNGKEIYEGDIVEICAMKMRGQILYDDVEYFAYLIVGFIDDESLNIHLGNFEWHKLEIVGNIHENPELLESK